MADIIQQRRDTAARWAQYNPILMEGEVGYVTDNPNQYKIGNGRDRWNDLPLRGYTGTITQDTGDDENAVMSQKATTEKLSELESGVTLLNISKEEGIVEEDLNGKYIDSSYSKLSSYSAYSVSKPILLQKGGCIQVNCVANSAVSVISEFNQVTNTYTVIEIGRSNNEELYEYVSQKDCYIVVSYNHSFNAKYRLVVSDTLRQLKNEVDNNFDLLQGVTHTENLISPTNIIEGRYISASTGELYNYSGAIMSGIIVVKPNTKYYIIGSEGISNIGCRFLSSELTPLKPLSSDGVEKSLFEIASGSIIKSPANSVYVQVQIKLDKGSIDGFMVAESDVPIPYIPYVVPIGYKKYAKLSKATGKNLFDKNSVIEGKFISNRDGSLYDSEDYAVSNLIKVIPNETYTFSGIGNSVDARGLKGDKKTIVKIVEDSTYYQIPTCITIPDGVEYIQFTVKSASVDYIETVQLEEGYIATEYEEYKERNIIPYENLPWQLKKTENPNSQSNSTLYSKIVSFNGDSICQGAENSGGYGKIIAQRNEMVYQNIGIGGGTITAEVYTQGGVARHWISRTIANMREDADYAIVEGGVNDASLNLPLGNITEGYSDDFDDTTFYGAFESMLRQLTIRFAGKKIGYIAVHQMTKNFRVLGDKDTNFYWAAKKCCEKWGVPFCDLNTSVPPFDMFSNTDTELYALKEAYFYNSDGWHPNEEGYKKYYCDKIEAWMKTL